MDNIEVSTTNYDGTSAKVVKQAKRIKFSELTSKVLQSWYKLRVKALESKIKKINFSVPSFPALKMKKEHLASVF